MKFRIDWSSRKRTIETAEAATPDAYAMERWGIDTAQEVFDLYGVTITAVGSEPLEPSDLQSPEEKTAAILAAKQDQ